MRRTAVLDSNYRYWLTREWAEPHESVRWAGFCGLNPSTADAEKDDPTIRREIDFARRLGFNGLIKVNLYAFRATDPKELDRYIRRAGEDAAIGFLNSAALSKARSMCITVFAAWGARRPPAQSLESLGRPLMCLGLTKNGSPRHPLYLAKNACPVEWRA